MKTIAEQFEFDFEEGSPELDLEKYYQEWKTAHTALGGCDSGGWMQDLCLYYDLQWNVETGEVGQTKWYVAALIRHHGPYDCREIHAPEGWSVPKLFNALQEVTGFNLSGSGPCNWREMIYRTADLSPKALHRDSKAKKKFTYGDRTARCGKLKLAQGVTIQPARAEWAS